MEDSITQVGDKAGFSAFFETESLESAGFGGWRLDQLAWYFGNLRYQGLWCD
jgi:hypothetical protein